MPHLPPGWAGTSSRRGAGTARSASTTARWTCVAFERLKASAAGALAEGGAADASADLRVALSLWRGPALSDLADVPGVARIAEPLDELRSAAVEQRIAAASAPARFDGILMG